MAMQTQKDFEVELNSFRTLNTKDSPVSMKDDELPILINFMPIGTTLYTIPGYSSVLASLGNNETTWTATLAATINVTVRRPTVANGFIYVCSQTGTTGGSEPTWPIDGSEVTDGTAKWKGYSCAIIRYASINIGGVIYKIFATVGGSLYWVDAAWTQTRLNVPSVVAFTNPRFEQWKYTNALIIDPTAGYYDYDRATLTHHTATSAPAAGTCIAIWKGSVFIGNGRTLYYSAPDSFTDFQVASGGGSAVDIYSSLRNTIVNLIAAQDYLYLVGDHGTHVATGIQTITGTATVISILDAVPGIGALSADAVSVLGSEIVEFGDTGINAVSGASFSLLSSLLDGTLPNLDMTFKPVGFFTKIYNKQVFCLLVKAKHPVDGTYQKFIFCYYESRWFFVLYGQDFTFAGQSATTTDTKTHACYDNNIIEIFTGETYLTKKARTKASNFGAPVHDKQVLWVGVTLVNSTGLTANIIASITAIGSGRTAESSTGYATVTCEPGVATWLNENGAVVSWGISWILLYSEMLGMKSCEGRGKRISIDYEESSAAAYTMTGILIGGQMGAPR